MNGPVELDGFHLNESFFREILSSNLKDETVKVRTVESSFMENEGTHYMSNIFRINVKYVTGNNENEEKSVGLIVKAAPSNDSAALEFLQETGLFDTEFKVFEKILPVVEELVQRQIAPKLYHSSKKPMFFVMEDLKRRNFVLKPRTHGLSLSYCLLMIEQIARFHAASVAIREKNLDMMKDFRSKIFSTKVADSLLKMVEGSIFNVSRSVRNWPEEIWPKLADKLERRSKTIRKELADIFHYESHEFCVLNHGDCWTNNVLFQENSYGNPVAALLIDYQTPVYTSPAIDLHSFLAICPDLSLKAIKDDFFLVTYLNTLTKTMKSIGCKTKPPSMEELNAAMKKRSGYRLMTALAFSTRTMLDPKDSENMNVILEKSNGETKLDIMKYPLMAKTVRQVLPFFEEKGYLD